MNYIEYRRSKWEEISELTDTETFMPVILFEGDMFNASMEGDDFTLKEEKHIQLRTYRQDSLCLVDIVNRQYFPEFVSNVSALQKKLEKAIGRVKVDIDQLRFIRERFKQLYG
jgi:hypothetical protein